MIEGIQPSRSLTKWTFLTFFFLMVGWVAAWFCKLNFEALMPWTALTSASFVYWTLAKLVLWVVPALWLIRMSGRSLAGVMNFQNYRSWLLWGGGLFLISLAFGYAVKRSQSLMGGVLAHFINNLA